MRRIAITSRVAVDEGHGGLGRDMFRAKGHRGELGEAGDTRNAEAIELLEARFMEVTATTMDTVSSWRSIGSEEDGVKGIFGEPSKDVMADKVDIDARGVDEKVARDRKGTIEAGNIC